MAKAGLTIAISGTYNGRALEKAREDLQKMSVTAASELGNAGSSAVNFGSKLAEVGGSIHNVGYKMESIGNSATKGITVPMAAAAMACGKAAIDIDSSLTGVRKTVDGTEEQYQQLKQAAIEFSKTNAVSASQILDLQALGAQLGYSIDELDMFSRVASGMDIATDMNAEQAATEMAQFANITHMAHDESENYASAIVNLGNNLATTESSVSSMAQRVAAASYQVGMSQDQILGWSGAMASMGIEAEAGGTAFSTTVATIDAAVATGGDSLEAFAKVAGMSADDFKTSWKNSASDTLIAMLQGVDGAENMTVALEEMGVTGIRQTDVLKRLAGNTDLVTKALGLSKQGWEENTALQTEVDNKNRSMSSQLEILKNKVTAVAESVGTPLMNALTEAIGAAEPLIEKVSDLAEGFANMDESDQQLIIRLAATAAAFGPVTSAAGKLLQGLGNGVVSIGGFVQKAGALRSEMGLIHEATSAACGPTLSFGQAVSTLGKSNLPMVTGALGTFKTALLGIGVTAAAGVAIAGIAAIVKGLKDWYDHEKNVEGATTDLERAMGSAQTAYDSYAQATGVATDATEDVAKSLGDIKQQAEEAMKSQADLASSMSDQWAEYGTNAAMVDAYAKQIEELTGKYDEQGNKIQLTANEQAALKMAVEGFNEATGASVEIIDAQNGQLNTSTDVIKANAEAFKEQARAQAAMEMYKDLYKQQITDEMALGDATKTLNDLKQKEKDAWADVGYNGVNPYSAQVAEAQKTVDELTGSIESNKNTQDQLLGVISGSTTAFGSLDEALANTGTSMSDFGELTDAQLQALQDNFDGSLSSIVQTCNEQGIEIPQSLAEGINSNSVAANEAAEGIGEDVNAGIAKGIEDTKDDVKSPITTVVDGVVDFFKNLFGIHSPSTVMAEIGADVDRGLAQGISETQADPVMAMQTMGQSVLEGLQNLPQSLREIGSNAGSLLSEGISGAQELARSAGDLLFNSGKEGANPLTDALGTIGTNAGQWLTENLGGFAGSALSAGQSLFSNAQNGANPLKESLRSIGQTAGSNLVNMVRSFTGQSQSAGSSLSNSGKSGANPLIAGLRSIGQSAGSSLVSMLNSFTGSSRSAGSSLNSSAQGGLNPVTSGFSSTGRSAASGFSSAIGGASAHSQGAHLAGTAKNGLASVNATGTGRNFVQGFKNGMSGVNLFSVAYSIGRSALNGIKSALGIASPSKEAAKVGAFFGQGAVIGMDSTVGDIRAEATKMSEAMSLEPSYGNLNLIRGGYSTSYQAQRERRGASFTFNVSVNVSGNVTAQNARQVGQDVGQALYEEFAKRERAYA